MSALRRHFGHAYATLDQPDFPDFVTNWRTIAHGGNLRAVFVGSKSPLGLPSLTASLPERHRNAPALPEAATPQRVWIDVGAYHGDASRQAALDDKRLLVHAFEPVPRLHEALAGGPDNYVVHAMAVSDRDGVAPFRINSYTAASSLLPIDEAARAAWIDGGLLIEEREIMVPTTRLDTFMNEAGIAAVEFLKVDAQGPTLRSSNRPAIASAISAGSSSKWRRRRASFTEERQSSGDLAGSNPGENGWQFLRHTKLSNRIFDGYEAIVTAACEAWNSLIADPARIKSIGTRPWAVIGQR
jgi:FkbM family methyltransferase